MAYLTDTPNIEGPVDANSLEDYFRPFRDNIIGIDQRIKTRYHESIPMIYADWTASGRAYQPIEDHIISDVLPFIANTHTDSNFSSSYITRCYSEARNTIKRHVNAAEEDVLISYGSGMTDVLNKLQRMLGLRVPEQIQKWASIPKDEVPVVFITHMEHHSNHTSWLETICEVVVVPPGPDGLVSLANFEEALFQYKQRKTKIASITACSNVTGIETPYTEVAKLMHLSGGWCFVDFACSAPYVDIDMHPDEMAYLDAIFFSPHKFLGGAGSSGTLLVNQNILSSTIPDVSGGGTVNWTNPWGGRSYINDVEAREDGGTPPIIQTIKAGYAMALKEEMGVSNIKARKDELMQILWKGLSGHPELLLLEEDNQNRQGIISFNVRHKYYTEVVEALNDRHGIQVRGGCSCAGTYGHYLLGVDQQRSKEITDLIDHGITSQKPGWVRLSIHPTMSNEEADRLVNGVIGCI